MIQLTQLNQLTIPDTRGASPAEDVLSLFVSDLATYVTEDDLYNVFHFPMDHLPGDALGRVYIYPFYITDVRLVMSSGGTSKYAFVRFPSVAERTRALYIMQGVLCLGRPIRLSRAHAKDRRSDANLVLFTNPRSKDERQRDNIVIDQFNSQWAAVDPKNTKVFVGGISPRIILDELIKRFAIVGTISNVNFGKGCAFISFSRKNEAALAIEKLDGMTMDGKRLRVTWSRSSVQPLLQQQRTLVPSATSDSEDETTPEHTNTHSPGSPSSPLTPMTPFGSTSSFPHIAGPKASDRSRSGSLSSKTSMSHLPNLYTLREVDEVGSPTLDIAPPLSRRRTIANVAEHRAGLLTKEMGAIKGLNVHSVGLISPGMGRRVSLPGNAL